jgi:hypothetical protein
MMQQTSVQKTKKYLRYFVKNTNTSIAVSATEEIFNVSMCGIVNELSVKVNGDDATQNLSASKIIITLDSVEVLNEAFTSIYQYFNAYQSDGGDFGGSLAQVSEYNAAGKEFGFKIRLDSFVGTDVVIEVQNADATNVLTVNAGLIYSIEV